MLNFFFPKRKEIPKTVNTRSNLKPNTKSRPYAEVYSDFTRKHWRWYKGLRKLGTSVEETVNSLVQVVDARIQKAKTLRIDMKLDELKLYKRLLSRNISYQKAVKQILEMRKYNAKEK